MMTSVILLSFPASHQYWWLEIAADHAEGFHLGQGGFERREAGPDEAGKVLLDLAQQETWPGADIARGAGQRVVELRLGRHAAAFSRHQNGDSLASLTELRTWII